MSNAIPATIAKTDWRNTVTWYTYETGFTRFIKAILRPLSLALAHIELVGLENVPDSGPGIIACNHFSLYDVIYMGVNLPRHPHFMAKRELYKNRLFGWLIRQFGSFPVYRGEGDLWAMEQAGRVLAAGQLLFMFPEGTRGRHKAQLKRGKVGVVKLALEHGVPVIPCAIWGTENFKVGWKSNQIHIQVGEPVDMVSLAGPPPLKHDVSRELTTVMMQKIAEMLPPEYRGGYG
ncbi:MAG: 1-acyl-sn-glycerol-3-phosphate acyltransferase [Anaerolineae bacterium]|nr:1-acyl-sn-glycerol-3-phosphate acyltransferase [Anaerolineae bacterium]